MCIWMIDEPIQPDSPVDEHDPSASVKAMPDLAGVAGQPFKGFGYNAVGLHA